MTYAEMAKMRLDIVDMLDEGLSVEHMHRILAGHFEHGVTIRALESIIDDINEEYTLTC